jgi:hypothetical protein
MRCTLVAFTITLLALARVSCVVVPFVPPCPTDALHGSTHAFTTATVVRRAPPRTDSRPAHHLHAENATRPRPPVQAPVDARRHERILVELMSAILQTDDVTLLDRDTQVMGVAYLDTNFTMCHPPLLLRNSVRDIMHRYDLSMIPLERKWTRVPDNETVDTIDDEFL